MLRMPSCPSRIFVTSSRLYPREISRSFASLHEQRPTTLQKPRAPPPLRTPYTTDARKRPQKVQPPSMQPHLLQPYKLSKRLIALCERGDTDIALHTLQHAPKNAQNVKVWNTLIQKCMVAEKYKLAHYVFIDMKRRGFIPNLRTYATLMHGYADVKDWKSLTKQLGAVHSIYEQLKQQLKTSGDLVIDGTSIQYPIALYICILGKVGEHQKAFDVFRDLDTDGSLVPDPKVYSALLCLLADYVDPEAASQTVSDAKYIWRRQMRSLDGRPNYHIERRSVDAIIKVLSRGEPSDFEFMFDILRDICGLPRPGEDCPPGPPKVKPNVFILTEALESCNAAGRPEMTIHYAQLAMDSPELRRHLHVWHLFKLVRAHITLAEGGSTSRARSENVAAWMEWLMTQNRENEIPNEYTITTSLRLCRRCEDMPSALRIARAVLEGPTPGSISAGAWAHLIQLAIVAQPNDRRQCLELLARHNSVLDGWESRTVFKKLVANSERKYHVLLARCIVQLFQTPLAPDAAGGPDATDLGQSEAWSDIRRRAKSLISYETARRLGYQFSRK